MREGGGRKPGVNEGMEKALKTRTAAALLAAGLTLIVFLPVLGNGFVNWDDNEYIYENTFIRSLDATLLKTAFFDYPVSYWHPLTWVSHAVDYAVWGLNPLGHHLTNMILHALNTLVVVLLIARLTDASRERPDDERAWGRTVLITAGVTGLLFGLHPLHVESVAWSSERKDLLCALFFLLSVMAYAGYSGRSKAGAVPAPLFLNKQYLLSIGFFVLALLSKPMAVTLPVVLLILDGYPFRRIASFKTLLAACVEKLPFIALSLFASILAILAQKEVGALATMESAPLSTRVLVAAGSLIAYLGKMVIPLNLIPLYPYPRDVSAVSLKVLFPVVLAAGITGVCFALAKRRPVWLSAWGYYVITLLPVLGLVQVGPQPMADRYTYLPSLGPFLVLGAAAAWGWTKAASGAGARGRLFSASVALFVFVPLIGLTVRQIGIWKDSISLWSYVIEKEPERVPRAYYNRALAFRERGELDRALSDYDRVIALTPSDYKAYYERGRILEETGRPDKAMADYDKAVALNPSFPDPLLDLGILYGKAGSFDKAVEYFSRSIAMEPENDESYNNRGLAYLLMGRYDRALQDFNRAILLNENNAAIYVNRGKLHLRTGDQVRAAADFRKACELGDEGGCAEWRASGGR